MAFCWNVMQQNNAIMQSWKDKQQHNSSYVIPIRQLCKFAGGIWGFGVFNNGDDKIAATNYS